MQNFNGKICVVTGGAAGVGYALCSRLAELGAKVVLADIDIGGAEAAKAGNPGIGANMEPVRVDVTDASSVRQLMEYTVGKYGRIDVLFNNAGLAIVGEIRDLSLEQWKRVIDVNLLGELHGIHYVYPIMIKQGFGHIVNMASGFGLAPGPNNAPYVTSKFGIVGMSETLRAEAKDLGIDVTVICPGYIKTGMLTEMQTANADPADVASLIPVKMVDVKAAADKILQGVARKKKVVAFPGYVGALTFLYKFVPGIFLKYNLKQIRNFRKIRKAAK
ncbi:SDR family oxidoreductase [Paenibacillus lycopersici]|uniref:SDR family oxidoreductase n=1 Tax=Paenibacillus lycopersici TaxID=2704462 RepID=A0A6C0G3M5_9BACL|nr:SDR family oxidoreductase [Paenibacillus lycopersici]QHT59365.1 SDR family oxidoreductase [Paenibacillus lycopersici]